MTLEDGFEDKLQSAVLDEVEHQLVGQEAPLLFEAISRAHGVLLTYGVENDYRVEPIIDSMEWDVDRDETSVSVTMGWTHPAAPYFEFGTSDHTIDGDPVLSFVWEDPPAWVKQHFDAEGEGWRVFFGSVEVSGIPESRFVRDALNWLRREIA